VDEDQELETQMLPTDDDKDSSDTSKPEFVTSPAALSIQVEEEGNAPMTTDESGHDGEALNDAGSNPTPIIPLEAHTLNSSINSNDTNNNETKPLRTVAFCALNPELVQVEEETLTLTLLPIISEREDFPLNSNESSAELESAGTESSSSVEGPSSESGTENEAEAPMPGTPSLRVFSTFGIFLHQFHPSLFRGDVRTYFVYILFPVGQHVGINPRCSLVQQFNQVTRDPSQLLNRPILRFLVSVFGKGGSTLQRLTPGLPVTPSRSH